MNFNRVTLQHNSEFIIIIFCYLMVSVIRERSLFMWGDGGEKSWGGPGLFFFREKGWAQREFHDDWGWVIVCFVKNHTHYNSCGRSK